MSSVLVNIGYCQEHYKGGDGINRMHGQEHAEWLERCVEHWIKRCHWPIFISMTGFSGWPEVENSATSNERDVLWRIFGRHRVRLVTMAANPGHQVGAAWCIRLGLEAAGKLGFEFMIHTAEDVVPNMNAPGQIYAALREGADYVGEHWGESIGKDECSAQFFGCCVSRLAGIFDPTAVPRYGHLEHYLRQLLPDGCHWLNPLYRTSHDHGQWQNWIEEVERDLAINE